METISPRLPNTFIVGAPKCGTSSLSTYLSEHPDVFFSAIREPHYWCSDFTKADHEPKYKTLDDYLKLFPSAKVKDCKIIAEGSTRYLRSKNAIKDIFKFNPNARFIVIVRNPLELTHAYHMEQAYSMREDIKDFETAWYAQSDRARGLRLPHNTSEPAFFQYKDVACVGEQIEQLLQIVPRKQVHIIVFDDYKSNTASVYKKVLDFLEIEDDKRESFKVFNPAHVHRYEWLAKLILRSPPFLEIPAMKLRRYLRTPCIWPIEFLKKSLKKKQDRVPIPENVIKDMKKAFMADVNLLSEILDRDLTSWVK